MARIVDVPLKQLRANPFRHIERYPIKEDKLQELMSSIEDTGFWTNVAARKVGDSYEIAYGHHRLEAAKKKRLKTIPIVVESMTDAVMLKRMAAENLEEWGSSADIEVETVGAVIEAFGNGRIELPKVPRDTPASAVKWTGDVAPTSARSEPYTAATVARFLGWTKRRTEGGDQPNYAARLAFDAYHALQDGFIKPAQLRGLTREQAQEMIRSARREREAYEREAREADRRQKEAKYARVRAEKEAKASQKVAEKREREREAQLQRQREQAAKQKAREARTAGKVAATKKATAIARGVRRGDLSTRDIRKDRPIVPERHRASKPDIGPWLTRLTDRIQATEFPFEVDLQHLHAQLDHASPMLLNQLDKALDGYQRRIDRAIEKQRARIAKVKAKTRTVSNGRRRLTA